MRRGSAALLLAAAVASACAGGRAPSGGRADAAQTEAPAFVVEAVGTVRDGATGVDVALGVAPASLVFRQEGRGAVAVARWTVTLEGAATRTPVDTVRVSVPDDARRSEPVWRVLRLDAPPGAYRLRVVLEDRASERTAEQVRAVEVAAPDGPPSVGTVRLVAIGGGRPVPVDASSVPAGLDSVRAVAQAVAPDASASVTVLRLRSDDTPAPPMTAETPEFGTLARLGVDPASGDTVYAALAAGLAPGPVVDVSLPLPPLDPGVYSVRLAVGRAAAERVVVVRRRDYPVPTRVGDLVGPLVYLATPREMARITGAASAAQRQAFDRFWGEQMDDRRLAAATVRAYYGRVEQANRQFATYKDGWKTDAGMVYVLFGPPRYVEPTPDGERWSYGSSGAAPPFVVFERAVTPVRPGQGFTVLTLVRDRAYGESLSQARRQWRRGIVP